MNWNLLPAAALALMLLFLPACVQEKEKTADWLELRETPLPLESLPATSENEITLKGFISTDGAFPSSLFYENEFIQFFSSIEGNINAIKIPLIVTEFTPCTKAKVKGILVKRNAVDVYSGKNSEFTLVKVNSFECMEEK